MSTPAFAPPQPVPDVGSRGLRASDFLLDPEGFVDRCMAAYPEAEAALTLPQRAALADAVRAGRPRFEVVEAVRRYAAPSATALNGSVVNGVAGVWSGFIVTDQLAQYAPGDDATFVQQVYLQTLDRSPTSIEAIEGKFDLKGGLSRTEFIQRIALRSPVCVLSSDAPPSGVGAGLTKDGKPSFNFLEPASADGWIVAKDLYMQPAPTIDGTLQLGEGWVLTGPKRTFPAGSWNLSIDIVQPETARITVDVVANTGLDVLAKFDLVGPARLVTAFAIEPWHHFLDVRLHKASEPEALRKLKVREFILRQQ